MAKTRRAATEYKRGKWHLARILEARWASLPGVGPDAPTILVLQIKLTVPYYWEAQPGTNLDANTPLEIVGSEAVVYVPCTKDRAPLTDEGDCFLHELGVRREATSDPLEHTDAWFKCEFGPIDPIYGYHTSYAVG
ncbi:MAG TPA: hypothetical protein VKP69_28040 [Isosphaeraceae bacterium]|nr:hypothetical protein [Isosphaeraceae bacterium]